MDIREQIKYLDDHYEDWAMPEYRDIARTMEKLLAVYEAAKDYKTSYELSEGGIAVDIEAELQQAIAAVQTKP